MDFGSLASELNSSLLLPLLLGVVAVILLRSYGAQRRDLPPGPRNWPVIGALLQMEARVHKAFEKLSHRYGPVMHLRLGVQTIVVVSSAEAAEEVLKHRDSVFPDRRAQMTKMMGKYAALECTAFPWSDYTADLKLRRKVLKMEFFSAVRLKSYEEVRSREMTVLVDRILSKIETSKNKDGQQEAFCTVGIRKITLAMMQNIIFKLCMGERFDDLAPDNVMRGFPELLERGLEKFMKFSLVDFFPYLERLDPQRVMQDYKNFEKPFRAFFVGLVAKHRQARKVRFLTEGLTKDNEPKSNNLVDILLSVRDHTTEMTEETMMGTIATLLMAGIDPVASEIEWTLLELLRHPHILRRLQEEIDGVVGKERPIREADLPAMPFLKAIVLEILRLYPVTPVAFPHVNNDPSTLGGYYIPPNTAVMVNIYAIGRDPKLWKDPLQFNPDRFMTAESASKSINVTSGGNYELLPFSSGRRMCVGASLAMLQTLRTVATLVHAFDLAPLPGVAPEDLSVEEDTTFVLHPAHELFLTAKSRLSSTVYMDNVF